MKSILIVDDDYQIRQLLLDYCEELGFCASAAPDGLEAVRRFRQFPFDIIVTDIYMPGQDGIDTILQLKADFPYVHIIAISGGRPVSGKDADGEISILDHALKVGASRAFKKPVDLYQLGDCIQELLKKK